jgi:hypothetical protein
MHGTDVLLVAVHVLQMDMRAPSASQPQLSRAWPCAESAKEELLESFSALHRARLQLHDVAAKFGDKFEATAGFHLDREEAGWAGSSREAMGGAPASGPLRLQQPLLDAVDGWREALLHVWPLP